MKVLLLDTNLSSVPIYNYLVNLGYEVFVVGTNKDDTIAISCRNYIQLDYSDVELVSEFVINNEIDIVLPGCNDISYKTASIINENKLNKLNILNISSSNINEVINNKNKFKKFALEHKLKVPKLYLKNEIDDIYISKLIVKPVDSYSGNGVSVLSDFSTSELINAIEFAESNSITGECIIEEFVSGNLYSHSAFIKDGDYFCDFIVQEFCTVNPYSVDTSWVIDNDKFHLYNEIRIEVEKIFKKLKLCDGLIHTQFIVDGDDFWILEVTRRCPGDLYSKLIEYSTGFNYSKSYVDFIINKLPSVSNKIVKKNILRKTITFKDEFFWFSLENKNEKIHIIEFFPLSVSGKKMQIAPKGRAGIVFYSSPSTFNINNLS